LDIEKYNKVTYPLMEAFYTIQGEGFYQGHAAYFIRLGGCDVGCHWCDVKDSWDAAKHPQVSVEEIVKEASKYPARIAVITGGEPVMYNLEALTEVLKKAGFRTHIETSGAYDLTGRWDWVCLSPKKFKEPTEKNYPFINELKMIIFNKSDFEFAEKYFKLITENQQPINLKTKFYLQPEWSKQQEMLPLIVEYVKNNPKWEVSLQVHKYMNIP
jgi:7-carboxy-7-deazaguanine synthase